MRQWLARFVYAGAILIAGWLVALGTMGQSHAATRSSMAAKAAAAQSVTIYVLPSDLTKRIGYKGPDGRFHDSMVPGIITFQHGVTVRMTVLNYDEGPHSITAPDLKLNEVIQGGKEADTETVAKEAQERKLGLGELAVPRATTFTLKVDKPGTYRWFCALPCDGEAGHWAMNNSQKQVGTGYMGGWIIVV
jgi:uncharacterized cupredoxin-like copper-binding protein